MSVAHLITEINGTASLEAHARECSLVASDVDAGMAVQADRDLLSAAVGNLLQNAFKFTRRGTVVTLAAYAKADRVRIEVRDCCGGLPPGDPENLFKAFKQSSADKSGLGLGLAISRRSVEANHGTLTAHDRPGEGCVFIIDLPRFTLPALVREPHTTSAVPAPRSVSSA